ncbi:MAG: hypothetical protein GXY83_01835 [Rhodopirellula sp.]|nr:hypothetical protein [Rhodopirellula sp.]
MPTFEPVFKKLDESLPLGYSNVGEVIEVGRGTRSMAVGDRVVSNSPHADPGSLPILGGRC